MKLKELKKLSYDEITTKRWNIGDLKNCRIYEVRFAYRVNLIIYSQANDDRMLYESDDETEISEYVETEFKVKCRDVNCSECPLAAFNCGFVKSETLFDKYTTIFDRLERDFSDESLCLLKRDVLKKIIELEKEKC